MNTKFYLLQQVGNNEIRLCENDSADRDTNILVVDGRVHISTDLVFTLCGKGLYNRASYSIGRKKFYSLASQAEDTQWNLDYPSHSKVMVETKKRNQEIYNTLKTLEK